MRFFKIIFWTLWRIWFFLMTGIFLIALTPFLFILTIKEKWYPQLFIFARIWGIMTLLTSGLYYRIERETKLARKSSYMFVANHTSISDIMLMLAVVKNPFVFVGKAELAKIPFFGFFYKRTCILVDRSNSKSRRAVFERAQKRLNNGLSICIFPEGGVPNDESIMLDEFKDGAFRLAIEHQIPIVPLTFADNKKRLSYTFFSGGPGILRVKVHAPISTLGKTLSDKKEIKDATRTVIYHQLLKFGIKENH